MNIMCIDPSNYCLGTKVIISDSKTGYVVHAEPIVDKMDAVAVKCLALAEQYNVTKVFCDNTGMGQALYDGLSEKILTQYSNITIAPLR